MLWQLNIQYFSAMTALIVEIFLMLLSIHNRLKMGEYEAHWLKKFSTNQYVGGQF